MQVPPFPAGDQPQQDASMQEWFRQMRDARFQILKKSVAGNAQVNLVMNESTSHYIEFTGVLTGNINVVVSNGPWQWSVFNNTTGAFTLTMKTLVGSGITVGQGKRAILLCDGVNVVRITADI